MRTFMLVGLVPAALLAGCTMYGDRGGYGYEDDGYGAPPPVPGDATPTDAMAYVEMAASGDLFEIQSSQLALTRSRDGEILQFAAMMVSDHGAMTQQLMAAARAAGVPPMVPRMLPDHAAMLDRLEQSSARAFDAEYARAQMMAHEMALELHDNYAERGDNPTLRSVAHAAVPRVRQHFEMAQRLPGRW